MNAINSGEAENCNEAVWEFESGREVNGRGRERERAGEGEVDKDGDEDARAFVFEEDEVDA